ncbi:MAG: ribosome-associated translation inhibitor RaiA [Elusimicrobia bacterium]|nr:ribosome-associated translation inhibitor RaiA [Elusimicrobiota bacterium]
MQIQITARHVSLTEAIANYLTKKINRLERYYDHLVWANAVLSVEKHRHFAEVIIHSPLHTLKAKTEADDLYAAIDLVADKVERQLKKIKEKQRDRHNRARRAMDQSGRAAAYYFNTALAAGLVSDGVIDRPVSPWPQSISVVKQVPVKPMAVDEAIRTMDSLGYTFWMFLNKNSRKFNVIFKRSDQSYGILEPAAR